MRLAIGGAELLRSAGNYTGAAPAAAARRANAIVLPQFADEFPQFDPVSDSGGGFNGLHGWAASELRETDMNVSTNRKWMGPAGPFRALAGDMMRFLLASIAAGIGISVLLALAILSLSVVAPPAYAEDYEIMKPGEATSGSFLVHVQPAGRYVRTPTLATEVDIKVSGVVARTKVTQKFRNDSPDWVEGIYVFPLPENAAVDRLRMRIGERLIEGQIREGNQARAEYQAAREAGRRASLLEQERPNIFTSTVANIGPGETLTVEIEFQQTLDYREGEVSLRFPLVVGPRYIPGAPAGSADAGWSADTDQVPDASRITSPVVTKGQVPRNPVSIALDIDAGFPVADIKSRHHVVNLDRQGESNYRVRLAQPEVPADRDFVITWRSQPGQTPIGALFAEEREDARYLLLTLFPPAGAQAKSQRMPREVIYVIDTSGSMQGASMEQAKRALGLAIGQLAKEDWFNVIQFNSVTDLLFGEPRPASPDNIAAARKYVSRLEATGGTEMAPALEAALAGKAPGEGMRQVIFLTDGSIGNEDHLFKLIRARLGASRLFTIGIGSAPNSHFMSKAAQLGRGSFTYIGEVSEVEENLRELFSLLEHPVLSDIQVVWPKGIRAEVSPERLPDLYLGQPVVLSARVKGEAAGELLLTGRTGGESWNASIALDGAQAGKGLGSIWARRKVESLMDTLHEGAPEATVKPQVIELALAHSLVTRYTSLVAIDVTPARPKNAALDSQKVPLNMPQGWSQEAVFGTLPQTATPALLHLLWSILAAAAAGVVGWRRHA
jgi:Ca-activated chloride channel homolog